MGDKPSRGSRKPPDWWNQDLYSYLSDMTLHGWVWEFMRRSRLKKLVDAGPVEAMIPLTQLMQTSREGKFSEKEALSMNWEIARKTDDSEFFSLSPAVEVVTGVGATRIPLEFGAVKFRYIMDRGSPPFHRDHMKIPMNIDIGRSDRFIIDDFRRALKQLRGKYPEPKRVSPHPTVWLKNKVLQVWDLKQYRVSLGRINSILKLSTEDLLNPIQPVRNAYKSALELIDENGWYELALYAEEDPVSST